jgi:hypothetical protein
MGQAKARGPFEVRKAEGEAKRQADAHRREVARAAYEASLTPAQRESRRNLRMMMAMAQGMLASSLHR